ncbi:sugar-binding transcriptional regulator [Paracoccaceae bacterium GXU_MW_L88]
MTAEERKLDQAARAAWLYYVGNLRQDEIARHMGVSRQTAQRLVAQAMDAGLVKVRIDHPTAVCLELSRALEARFDLQEIYVVPDEGGFAGVAMALADAIERDLNGTDPITLAIGTGRTLRAAVLQLARIDCPQHKIVSLTGNIAPDGSAAYYNVMFSLSERVTARSYPLMVPVIAATVEEVEALHRQPGNARVIEMARRADVGYIGIGSMDDKAALLDDGFLSRREVEALRAAGAVGEILGWPYDAKGNVMPNLDRVAAPPLSNLAEVIVTASVFGLSKGPATLGALRGGLINGLICDQTLAAWILDQA